jgi:hypothetical protein
MPATLPGSRFLSSIGSKLARSACGTKRYVRAAARCEIAGLASPAAAAALAAVFKNVLRSMTPVPFVKRTC